MTPLERIERLGRLGLDERALRAAVLGEIRRMIPFDRYVWLLTDPLSGVGTSPLADVPELSSLPQLIKLRYLTVADRWTSLPAGVVPRREPASSAWRGFVAGFGISDVLSAVCRDAFGCWGFIDLWRAGSPFTDREREQLAAILGEVTSSVRRSIGAAFTGVAAPQVVDEPVVALVDDDLGLLSTTPPTDAWLRTLLPTARDEPPVPAAVYNVAAQLLAVERGTDANPPWARAHAGTWVTLRAARMAGQPIPVQPKPVQPIVVTATLTTPADRTDLYARVIGLTGREADLLVRLVAGADTRGLAEQMFISEHTVQDHLKAIFAKAGTRSRRVLVARATGAG